MSPSLLSSSFTPYCPHPHPCPSLCLYPHHLWPHPHFILISILVLVHVFCWSCLSLLCSHFHLSCLLCHCLIVVHSLLIYTCTKTLTCSYGYGCFKKRCCPRASKIVSNESFLMYRHLICQTWPLYELFQIKNRIPLSWLQVNKWNGSNKRRLENAKLICIVFWNFSIHYVY